MVLREEIDLLEVPLLQVILAYLDDMEEAGASGYWDEMTEFLLLMSMLLEVKSRLLLPGAYPDVEADVSPEQARDLLLDRLYEYSKLKAASERLRESAEATAACTLRRPAAERRRRLPPLAEIAGSEDALQLREHLARLLQARREPDTGHIVQIKVDLQRQIKMIREVLAAKGRFSFNGVFGGEQPLVQALSLFALLDLLARGEIRVAQARPFADMVVSVRQARKTA